ncbi:MAG: hypothetical protein NZ484_01880 [Patescibacteria group bacterium]|nr:hypothetical protein [Patescibacteria group bacterium]MCX7589649.1 hypothetical protein [Patescibacteria group bacterium]MDW8279623.1 hypothetical protein [bacterium]
MEIFNLLKQLKNEIKPDKDYMLFSRQRIISEFNQEFFDVSKKIKITIKEIIYSISFTFAMIFIIFGFFVVFKNLTPKLGVLNPEAIKAEADAIDFQIKISKLIYNMPEKSNIILNSVAKNNIKQERDNSIINSVLENKDEKQNELSNSTNTQNIELDQILDYLSQ